MFLKILPLFDLNVERRDSLTVRCLCVFLYPFFLRSAFCQWFCSPRFTPGGIRFLVEVAAEMCVTEFRVLCAGVSLILPVPRGEEKAYSCQHQSGKRKVFQAVVQLGPARTHKHTCSICDGRQRQAQLPSLLLNSRTAIIKCPPSPIKTNSLVCALLLSIGLTDTNDCVIHPPLPHPLLTAPVSHRALAQSRDSFLPLP